MLQKYHLHPHCSAGKPSPFLVKQESSGLRGERVTELGPGTPGFQALAACPNNSPAPFQPLPRGCETGLSGWWEELSTVTLALLPFSCTQDFPFVENTRNSFIYIYNFIYIHLGFPGGAGGKEPTC